MLKNEEEPQGLLLLKKLPQLRSLELAYQQTEDVYFFGDRSSAAFRAAPVWPQLQQQLVSLVVELPAATCSYVEMAAMMQGVCKIGNLTQLVLSVSVSRSNKPLEAAEAASIWQLTCPCQMLKHLTKLNHLKFTLDYWAAYRKGDMLHLSCLTGLTQLHLSDQSERLDDAVVAAMLLELTELQALSLYGVKQVGILAKACMPIVSLCMILL